MVVMVEVAVVVDTLLERPVLAQQAKEMMEEMILVIHHHMVVLVVVAKVVLVKVALVVNPVMAVQG